MKKILALLISVLCAAGISFSLAGCGEKVTPPEPVKPPITENPEPESSMTFEEFISDHFVNALKFYNDNFSGLTAGKDLLAQTVSIGANSEDKLNSVTVTYTYKVDDTKRKIEKTTATITFPVVLDKIVDGSVAAVNYTLKTEEIFSFDVREVKENSVLAENLFSVANLNSDVKIFAEVDSIYNNVRAFQLLTFNDGVYTVGEISVIVDNKSQENLLENMQKPSKVEKYSKTGTYSATKDGEAVLISSLYNFAGDTYTIIPDPEEPDHGSGEEGEDSGGETEETIGSVAELIQNYNDEVYQALNDTFLNRAGRKIIDQTFKIEKLVETKWDIGNSDIISEIKLILTYEDIPDNYTYGISTITLATPIDLNEVTVSEIESRIADNERTSTYAKNYTFFYTNSIQGTRDNLVNAIFAACGHELTEGSKRFFYDGGHILDSTIREAHIFNVAEITENKVQEFTVRIREASNDEGYIDNLEKENNFIQTSQQSLSLSGNFITQPQS